VVLYGRREVEWATIPGTCVKPVFGVLQAFTPLGGPVRPAEAYGRVYDRRKGQERAF
jgi:hypothetical protein